MKLTFLGTGAGETYPGYWCECPHCTYARKHRGKNLRTNSSMVIDEELLIDMGPSCFDNAARFGVNLSKLKTLLVTHPHEDHLYPQHLHWRNTDESLLPLTYVEKMRHGGPRFTDIPQLNIYGNSFVMETLRKSLDDMEELIKEAKKRNRFLSFCTYLNPNKRNSIFLPYFTIGILGIIINWMFNLIIK